MKKAMHKKDLKTGGIKEPAKQSIKRKSGSILVQTLIVPGEFPTLNEIIKKSKVHWSQYAVDKKIWTLTVQRHAKSKKIHPASGPVQIDFVWYRKNRRQDPDNIAYAKKYVLDGLVAAGILSNDGWKQIIGFSDTFKVSTSPYVEIIIMES